MSSPKLAELICLQLLCSMIRVLSLATISPPHHAANTNTHPSLIHLRTQSIHSFDTKQYPLLEAVRAVFASYLSIPESHLPPLDSLHMDDRSGAWCVDGSNARLNLLQHRWNSQRSVDATSCGAYAEFAAIYRRLVSEVVAPIMLGGDNTGGGELGGDNTGGAVVFQRAPGLRVSPPSTLPLGKMHCDREYHHQPSEINFWLPLTKTFDNNTLWVESSPNLGDFSPLTLEYGEMCKFYGNACRHVTYPNNSNSSRVSIDFRAVSSASGGHDPDFRKGTRRGSKANFDNAFDIGGFYDIILTQ